ncbi:uncharacterized protein BDV17DRAFT_285840 [Aspergillus undulatus]|uniref:uncharacterized protein n=1 Tax=Aspergillus undulatus TaxID=1810928 RepID=UPI003CCE247F
MDAEFQFRVDAGRYDPETKLIVNLQINSQATSPALKGFSRKKSTHAELATATFNTAAENKDADFHVAFHLTLDVVDRKPPFPVGVAKSIWRRFRTAMARNLGLEPCAYTSGRWLRHDRQQIDSRHISLNFDALCQQVIELCPGARSIVGCRKIEGGFNAAFIFTLDNDQKLVAKLPFRPAGPARLTIGSEIATIQYLQEKTRVPIPKILAWHDNAMDSNNLVGSEYIIMEHALGISL